jgi:hypothetical protein
MFGNTGLTMAQFTAGSTARLTHLQLGFVPDFVQVIALHTATNPNFLYWYNKAVLSQWLDADDHLLLTGSSGEVTRVTTGIAVYEGGEVIEADETINSNPVHPYTDGTFPKAGVTTSPGISLPAAILTANGLYIVNAWRRNEDGRHPDPAASDVVP